jgi:uncharacterized metal-binding protein YceD (DUF177 family)
VTPELSRVVALDTIGSAPRSLRIEADEAERITLARRFGLLSLDRLVADVTYHAGDAGIEASGTLEADLVQPCAASGAPVPASLSEPFALRFIAPVAVDPGVDEIEIETDDLDVVEHDGRTVDLGEAVAQTLGLSLDPFPRSTDADRILKEAGVLGEDETGPFAALKGLFNKT